MKWPCRFAETNSILIFLIILFDFQNYFEFYLRILIKLIFESKLTKPGLTTSIFSKSLLLLIIFF